ncbi:helix-turn-helix domain-containing protein [Nocardioides stalactiti]|uniref:helix-turn-helix domain-containing protein n=1 Tax=Nocardioides stalactiti TaxID=2755356 RepID=UPI001C7F33A4|nr:helix-turn-helix domain-containing protein [Nocardioides stalactiti]
MSATKPTVTKSRAVRPSWADFRNGPPTRVLWPDTGRALGLGRSATYAAASAGEIPTIRIGRKILVPVPALLRLLGDEGDQ